MIRLTDRPDMTLDVYRGRKTAAQQQQQQQAVFLLLFPSSASKIGVISENVTANFLNKIV